MADPRRVLVCGDWHASLRWGIGVVEQLPALLPDEAAPIIVHTGDFGVWRDQRGTRFLGNLTRALREFNAEVWFVDGNHEDHDELDLLRAATPPGRRVPVTDRIFYLPRGHRWTWHDRTWIALGGAVSINKPNFTPGLDWFPQEQLTYQQAQAACADGPADVVIAHDCPWGVDLRLPYPPHLYGWTDALLDESDRHRILLSHAAEQLRPRWWMHGHYHKAHQSNVDLGWGPMQVTGFDCNGAYTDNYRVLDVKAMQWEPRWVPATVR
jgi:hypothetical protein